LAQEQDQVGSHFHARKVFYRQRIIPARKLTFLISRIAVVRDPYARWCGRAPQGWGVLSRLVSDFENILDRCVITH
jgi:hypothetical protein